MYHYPADIYTEPEPDPDTLANLGPLSSMAGIWTSAAGMDVNLKPDGPEHQPFIERYELQPIDAQTNGPQLFYGLRYHTRIVKPGDPETCHDQVGYWLWEPATHAILLTLSIPRGQTAMAVGHAAPDAKSFTLAAVRGSLVNGIVSAGTQDNGAIQQAGAGSGVWETVQGGDGNAQADALQPGSPPTVSRETCILPMLMPASPRILPTVPTTPGRSV